MVEIIEREELDSEKISEQVESTSKYIEVRALPSNFLAYPKNSRIWYKPYCFSELEDWSAITSDTPQKDKFQLGMKGIKIEGFNPWELALADYNYIMTLRKLSTYDRSKFNLSYNCPHCYEQVHTTQEMDKIEFKQFEVFDHLPVVYKTTAGEELVISTMTIGDVVRFLDSKLPDSKLTRLAFQIQNKKIGEAIDFLSELDNPTDIRLLLELEEILNFGKSQSISLVCPHCKKPVTISLLGVSALAEPFRDTEESLENRIISSKK